jgi:hypothetical protein
VSPSFPKNNSLWTIHYNTKRGTCGHKERAIDEEAGSSYCDALGTFRDIWSRVCRHVLPMCRVRSPYPFLAKLDSSGVLQGQPLSLSSIASYSHLDLVQPRHDMCICMYVRSSYMCKYGIGWHSRPWTIRIDHYTYVLWQWIPAAPA